MRAGMPLTGKGRQHMAQEYVRVLLQLKTPKAISGLTVDSGCMPRRKRDDGTIEMVAVVTRDTLKKLQRKRSLSVEVLGDEVAEGKMAAAEVSRTNRYADGSLPLALGLKGVRRVD
jgi:hypothetical protein